MKKTLDTSAAVILHRYTMSKPKSGAVRKAKRISKKATKKNTRTQVSPVCVRFSKSERDELGRRARKFKGPKRSQSISRVIRTALGFK
jgi:hypothetical protein